MIKHFLKLFVVLLSLGLVTSCDYDDDFVEPNYVTFDSNSIALDVLENSSTTREVTIYTGNKVGTDRTFNLVVDATSTLATSVYELPSSVVVPANSNEVSFTVNLSDNGLANSGGTLVLMLEKTGTYSTGNPLTLNVSKVCPFDINRFVGTFDATEVFTAGSNAGFSFLEGESFPVELALNPDDASGNSLVLIDASGNITGGSVLTFDPATGAFTIPADTMVFGRPLVFASSKTDSCNEKLSFTGALGAFGQYTVTLQKI
jgi:hypothetical protein